MNGVTDEVGKVAGGVVSGLAAQPLALALIVINVLFMGIGVWIITEVAEANQRRDGMLMQLAKDCTFPPAPKKE